MGRAPPNTPTRKDRVEFRNPNDTRCGVILKMNDATGWASVKWDGVDKIQMCHVNELVRLKEATK